MTAEKPEAERLKPQQARTLNECCAEAGRLAVQHGRPFEVWEHVGGHSPKGYIAPTGRRIVRDTLDSNGQPHPAPRWAWAKVETVQP